MEKIEEAMQGFAKKEYVEELNRKLYGFYPVKEAMSERELVNEKLAKLEEAIDERAMKKSTDDELRSLENQIKINKSLAGSEDARR